MLQASLYKTRFEEECSFFKTGVYKRNICAKVFTEKKNLLRHEKNAHGEKNSYKCELCNKVYGRAEHLRRHKASTHFRSTEWQCSKCKKTFARADNLNRHKCKMDQETRCSPDSKEAPSNDVTTEQPTDKDLVGKFSGEASFVDESPTKKRCLKENSTNCVKNFRLESLNIKCNNLYEDIEQDENEQAMESDPEIKAFMLKQCFLTFLALVPLTIL